MANSAASVVIVGCPSVDHEHAEQFKHRWFVINEAGQLLEDSFSQALSKVELTIKHGDLTVRAPGMLRLDIPMDVIEDDDSVCRQAQVGQRTLKVVDEGDLAAAWFGNVTGCPCRLVKVHPDERPLEL